jgi:competence ComEA-like helix-hairpin-helix protein
VVSVEPEETVPGAVDTEVGDTLPPDTLPADTEPPDTLPPDTDSDLPDTDLPIVVDTWRGVVAGPAPDLTGGFTPVAGAALAADPVFVSPGDRNGGPQPSRSVAWTADLDGTSHAGRACAEHDALLRAIAGLGPQLAQAIVAHRAEHGAFETRAQLKEVPRLGARAFEQCAGFLRITGGSEPLDASSVHPERYAVVTKMAKDLSATTFNSCLMGIWKRVRGFGRQE